MENSETFHPKRILCPVDFSELSNLALKYAAAGARAFGASLVVFHAQRFLLPPYFTSAQIAQLTRQHREEKGKAKEFLRRHVQKVLGAQAQEVQVKVDVVDAHPVDAVLEAARRHRAELIVMGTHGRGGAKRLWLGSVAENVIRQAGVPVFVARQKQHEFLDASQPLVVPKLRRIFCPVNLGQAAHRSLEHAVSLARQFNARLIAGCILEPGDARKLKQAKQDLSGWIGQTNAAQCQFEAMVRKGRAGERIVSLAAETNADLIVLGVQDRGPLNPWRWSDTAEYVLRRASVPVLVVP